MTTADTSSIASDALRFLTDPVFRQDPSDFYDRLHAAGPVHPIGGGTWLVSGFAQVDAALRDGRFSRALSAVNELAIMTEAEDPAAKHAGACLHSAMLMQDPPEHTRVRKLTRAPFLPRSVARWEPFLREVADELADAFPAPGTVFDIKRAFGLPIPERAICRILGVPYEDHRRFEHWGEEMVRADRSGNATPEQLAPARDAQVSFANYMADLAERRATDPGDDLLSDLLSAEEDGDRLTSTELVGNLMLLVLAGHETTANTISSLVVVLMDNRDAWERLVTDPSLVPAAVEETLRLEGAQRFMAPRVTTAPVEIGGHAIPAGDRVIFLTQAANRDPSVFDDPAHFDLERQAAHVGFGIGAHLCLGMHLARLEMNVALETLVRRVPTLHLAVDRADLRGGDAPTIRGWEEVPVIVR